MRVLVFLICAIAQAAEPPTFEQFPAGAVFHGTPAPARPTTKGQLLFKTAIRDGAKQGPNFAGHYTVVTWGCGSGCISNAIVDAKDGAVFSFPFDALSVSGEGEPVTYRLDSRLLVVRGCPNEKDCSVRYYEWNNSALKLIRSDKLQTARP